MNSAWQHRCSLQRGISKGLQQDTERTRELFAGLPVEGLEDTLHVGDMKPEDRV